MKTRTIIALLSCLVLTFFLYVTPYANAASAEEEVLQVESNFIKAGITRDLALMSSLYWHSSKTSTFNPVTFGLLNQGWEDTLEKIWKYRFDSATETTTSFWTFDHPQVIMLKDDVAILLGYETAIDTDSTTNEQTTSKYRVTRVLQKIGGKWQIVHDHVSAFPTE